MSDRELIKDILLYIFEELNSQNIDYCVLKNYNDLPEALNAQDIDILVKSRIIGSVRSIFCSLLEHFPVKNVLFSRRGNVNRFEILADKKKALLVVEFWTGIDWYCFPILSINDILGHRLKYKSFYISSPVYTILVCWLVPFMYGGRMKERYRDIFRSVYTNNKDEVEFELSRAFGNTLAKKIANQLDMDNTDMVTLRNAMRARILLSSPINYGLLPFRLFSRLTYDVIAYYFGKYPQECC